MGACLLKPPVGWRNSNLQPPTPNPRRPTWWTSSTPKPPNPCTITLNRKAPPDIAAQEEQERQRVLGWLEELGVVSLLSEAESCWRLGRLVAVGDISELSEQELRRPVPAPGSGWRPVLTQRLLSDRGVSDHGGLFVEASLRAHRRAAIPATRGSGSESAAAAAKRCVAAVGLTRGLVNLGFGGLVEACSYVDVDGCRAWAHEAVSYAKCRLVDEGVASSELWGKLLVPELGGAAYEHYLRYDYDAVMTRLHPRVAWTKLAPRVKTQYQVVIWGSGGSV